MSVEEGCYEHFIDPAVDFSIVFEDDGRAAYAYLLDPDNKIVQKVWLYNVADAPAELIEPVGEARGDPPLNPAEFVDDRIDFRQVTDIEDVVVTWVEDGAGTQTAVIDIYGQIHATLTIGEEVGRCRLARKDGPFAQAMKPPT